MAAKSSKLFDVSGVILGSDLPDENELEYIEMPKWWQESTKTKGLPFNKFVVIAGDSDSGKTSCCITAAKQAQDQGVTVLYVETEGKLTRKDLKEWGVDLNSIYLIQTSIAEDVYDRTVKFVQSRVQTHPKEKLLIILDSIGNVLSQSDLDRSMMESAQRPGGKGKANREGLLKLLAMRSIYKVAILLISYTYDNIGSPGKTNAGGKAINFDSSLTYQTSRKGWLERTEKGTKIRIGARVVWKLFKNHIDRSSQGPKEIEFEITKDGFKYVGGNDSE